MSSNIDDDFDWEAAVAEIDKACNRHTAPENGVGEPSSTQSRTLHQRTLDSFIRGGGRQRSTEVTKERAQYGNGGALDSSRERVRQQSSTGADFRTRQVRSDEAEASSSGCPLPLDYEAAKVWIYPANVPRRSYQFSITETALFCNTLVCLPTGLGKTLIAAVVIYNYYRWFPTGKIIFAAPSRPLVVQQIEACHKVTGIPQDMTIDMTGQMSPQIRAEQWQSRRVFFVTPQVLEKDIQAGRAATKQIVCLVVDEAHRATGNYSYCVVVRELLAAKVAPRILALTATPGSKKITIQAVVDNLQISCLEYRDEHDPDVSKYTHNRKIELVEVPMNAESTQVKDVFIEVLQPIVQRLCYLGVFYSREISRLSAYEFLTARDKFRQAPPQALPQSKYQDVETYFGLAITLFHIFKLLITHGMRPAYEMLRQKVENGVLRRLAKNEKLLQVQELMKQSIGHGAPSPKLDKVVEIVNDHFRVYDATNTRVIIFTNFRESVKFLETASADFQNFAIGFVIQPYAETCFWDVGTDVDSSKIYSGSQMSLKRKTSKGQTQKTQQAVLQRFRGGSYNTIVATSIAEEGLDIMEVDLVLCFDANISPLRMIQRMGRTGRKRDGRVVVLASGGSEIQGYLKKQSKSKALGKHMVNGGLNSFNFHESHHMIPHSLRTAVQFVELAIEDFVPRGRKLKDIDQKPSAGVPRKLTEKELEMVKLVKAIPDLNARMKGGPEDPLNKFFASPVHQVKHSRRSCLLIDCLQTLGVAGHFTCEDRISRENVTLPLPTQLPLESNIFLPVNNIKLPTSALCEDLSDDSGADLDAGKSKSVAPIYLLPSSSDDSEPDLDPKRSDSVAPIYVVPSSSASSPEASMSVTETLKNPPLPKADMCEQSHHEPTVARNTISSRDLDNLNLTNNSEGDFVDLENTPLTPRTKKGSTVHFTLPGNCQAKVVAQPEHQQRSFLSSNQPDEAYSETLHRLDEKGSHRCRDIGRVVSAAHSGLVLIPSLPSLLRTRTGESRGLTKPSGQFDIIGVNSTTLQQRETGSNNKIEQTRTAGFSPLPSTLTNHTSDLITPVGHKGKAHQTIEIVEDTPEEKVEPSSSKPEGQQKFAIQARVLDFEELCPRLAEFANHGVVPSTPRKETTPVAGKLSVPSSLENGRTEGGPLLPFDGQTHISTSVSTVNVYKPPRTPVSHLPSASIPTGRTPQQRMGLTPGPAFAHPAGDVSPEPQILTHRKARPLTFDHLNTERLPMQDRFIQVVNNGSLPVLEENLQCAGDHSRTKTRSPLQVRSSKSSGEDWKINENEAIGSVQKPRKLKRPRRACGQLPLSQAEESSRKTRSPLQSLSSGNSVEDWQISQSEPLGSVQKPRKLKRLRRACEKSPAPNAKESLRRNQNSSVQDQVRSKVHRPRLETGKHRRKFAARAFIDEEAEVSSDDEDEDLSGTDDCEDEEEYSQSFIDTAATQHLNGSVDMINIYRKSLLTPSPLGHLGAKYINMQQGHATPSSNVTASSIEPSSASQGLEDELSDFGTAPSVRRPFVHPQNPVQTTRIPDLGMDGSKSETNCTDAIAANTGRGAKVGQLDNQDLKKQEFPKRKLSFQTSSSFEDDLFEGVDLDALEAEATEISRLRSQAQVVSTNTTQEQVVARSGSLPSRHSKHSDFQFIPSFDLGLGN